jgi:predicted metal-dependent hydrolase
MTLRVSDAGVRLTVPSRARAADVDAFLRASAGWVRDQRARLEPPPPALAAGDRIAYLDGDLLLAVARGPGRAVARRDGDRLVVPLRPGGDLVASVEGWYRHEAARVLGPRARRLAGSLGARVAALSVRDPRSRWGSCSATGRLSFSWRLLLAPEEVLDYVVAHEVCHLLRPDHSPAYWSLVASVVPHHERPRRWLREHGALLHRGPAWRAAGAREAITPS